MNRENIYVNIKKYVKTAFILMYVYKWKGMVGVRGEEQKA